MSRPTTITELDFLLETISNWSYIWYLRRRGLRWCNNTYRIMSGSLETNGNMPSADHATGEEVDVVVIGAGLAGLTAARDIIKSGLSCIILEARDRVGGKTWSQQLSDGRGTVDLGAAWINDVNQTQVYALAKQYNAELIEQNTTGNCAIQDASGTVSGFPYGELPSVSF